jgi:hypothetical protein
VLNVFFDDPGLSEVVLDDAGDFNRPLDPGVGAFGPRLARSLRSRLL